MQLLLHNLSVSSSPGVEVGAVFVPHLMIKHKMKEQVTIEAVRPTRLSSRFASSVLPAFDEASVPIRADDAVVETRAVDIRHGLGGVLSHVVLDEAETTRSPLELIQPEMNICNTFDWE